MMPSMRDKELVLLNIMLSRHRRIRNSEVNILKGISLLRVLRSILKGEIAAVKPKISRMLQMLEPTTLPSDMSPCPCKAEDTEMSISGEEVPMPTIVRPMMKFDSLARWAIATEDSTR